MTRRGGITEIAVSVIPSLLVTITQKGWGGGGGGGGSPVKKNKPLDQDYVI